MLNNLRNQHSIYIKTNQFGFTTAAIGFIVFGLLMTVIVFSENFTDQKITEELQPALSNESSPVGSMVAKATQKPMASASAVAVASTSSTPIPSATAQSLGSPTSQAASPVPAGRYIKITSPNGGESYEVGSKLTINWEYNDLAQCVIKYMTEDGKESALFIPVNPSQKTYQLAVLENYLGTLDSVKLKISMDCYSSSNNYEGDTSDGYFTVTK